MGMKLVLLVVAVATTGLAAATISPAVAAERQCGSSMPAADGHYGYAGHEANAVAAGVRATITPLVEPQLVTGHVAAWVGIGGPRNGPNGSDEWLQAGIASVDGSLFVYAEF